MSTDIVIAHESISKELTERMAAIAASWLMTSAVSEAGAAKTESLIEDALERGASIAPLSGSTNVSFRQATAQLHPIILTGVNDNMRIYHEESFGPVVSVLTFKIEEEAVQLANDSVYGLSASVFTRNIPLAIGVARKMDSGAVHINSMTVHDKVQLPHGGMKASGWGRFGVPWGKLPQKPTYRGIGSILILTLRQASMNSFSSKLSQSRQKTSAHDYKNRH
jgi:acyl-CoA reductase-like NAD-dependent aldehyde dehydrogenase